MSTVRPRTPRAIRALLRRCRHEELRFRLWLYDPSRRRHVEPPAAISRSATTVGALTIALAFDWAELLVAFAHDPPETLALQRGEVGELACDPPEARALQPSEFSVASARDRHDTLAVGELACDPP